MKDCDILEGGQNILWSSYIFSGGHDSSNPMIYAPDCQIIGSSRLIRNGRSRSPSVLCIWHLRCIRSLSQSVMAEAGCWWSDAPPASSAFSSPAPSTARTTGRTSSSSKAPSGWIGWWRWWEEWSVANADTDICGWSLLQQHNIRLYVFIRHENDSTKETI